MHDQSRKNVWLKLENINIFGPFTTSRAPWVNESFSIGHVNTIIAPCMTNMGERLPNAINIPGPFTTTRVLWVNESFSLGHINTSIAPCMTNLGEHMPDVETSMLITSQINLANLVYHSPQLNQHGHSRRISAICSFVDKYWSFTAPFYTMSQMKSCKNLLNLHDFMTCDTGCDILYLCCIECYRSMLRAYPRNHEWFQDEATPWGAQYVYCTPLSIKICIYL